MDRKDTDNIVREIEGVLAKYWTQWGYRPRQIDNELWVQFPNGRSVSLTKHASEFAAQHTRISVDVMKMPLKIEGLN